MRNKKLSSEDYLKTPFSPKLIRDLIRNGVFNASAVIPRLDDPAFNDLAQICERTRTLVWNSRGPWREEEADRGRVETAVQLLVDLLPKKFEKLIKYNAIFEVISELNPELSQLCSVGIEAAFRELAVLWDLEIAAKVALRSNVLKQNIFEPSANPVTERHELDLGLFEKFLEYFPMESAFTAYRFVAAVAPYITGDETTAGAVRKSVARQRQPPNDD